MQAKRAFEIVLGKMLQPTADKPDDEEVPYLKALHVQWGRVELDELPTMRAAPWEIEQLSLAVGDLLVCKGGEVGRAARLTVQPPEKCIIQNALHRVRGEELGHVGFLSYCLRQAADKGWFDVL
jgi:type I restriction enzyme S subunit